MKVSREQMAENHRKILEVAGRLFRERGFDAVTVAEVMKAAGLTHGGFYGHFRSKEDLIAETLAHALASVPGPTASLDRYAAGYLSPRHRDDRAGGCPTAALATETIRQSPEARAAMTAGLKKQIDALTACAPGDSASEKRRAAIGSWSAMVVIQPWKSGYRSPIKSSRTTTPSSRSHASGWRATRTGANTMLAR